jgi:aryl-phospho-beta-D-glucosidase BglC (GH1 family)
LALPVNVAKLLFLLLFLSRGTSMQFKSRLVKSAVSFPISGALPLSAAMAAALCVSSGVYAADTHLVVSGTSIVAADNPSVNVQLQGVNLGGWLVPEMSMIPFNSTNIPDAYTLWNTLQNRFGQTGMESIRTAWRSNWITQNDFTLMHQDGFNTVRIPFEASMFTDPNEDGFKWLDQAVNWASQDNMYVILDMHGAPGGQSASEDTGQQNQNQFFSSQTDINQAAQVWGEIAQHYKGNAAIAGYDLLNEPVGAPNYATLDSVYNQLYNAVRNQGDEHIIFMEPDNYSDIGNLPSPSSMNWYNVAYSGHIYHWSAPTQSQELSQFASTIQSMATSAKQLNVPAYVGEFGLVQGGGNSSEFKQVVSELDQNNMAWTAWPWKEFTNNSGLRTWGVMQNPMGMAEINPLTDSYSQIMADMSMYQTSNFSMNPDYAAVPEPSVLSVLGVGLVVVGITMRHRVGHQRNA